METSKCECGNEISSNSYREAGTVNDKYLIIYECDDCNKKGFTVTTNTKIINGAKVLKVMDTELYSKEESEKVLLTFGLI